VYLIDKPGAAQSFNPGGKRSHHRATARRKLRWESGTTYWAGTFGGRVNMNLREDKHWSYGARTTFQFARGDSAWVTQAPVQTDKTKESLVELNKELRDMFGARPISQDETQ